MSKIKKKNNTQKKNVSTEENPHPSHKKARGTSAGMYCCLNQW